MWQGAGMVRLGRVAWAGTKVRANASKRKAMRYARMSEQAKVTAARVDLQAIGTALEMYRLDNLHYPSTQQGLEALSKRPSGVPTPRSWNPQGYLKSLPVDPWGTPYQYLNPGVKSDDGGYDLYSLGSDGVTGGEGHAAEIGNWGG